MIVLAGEDVAGLRSDREASVRHPPRPPPPGSSARAAFLSGRLSRGGNPGLLVAPLLGQGARKLLVRDARLVPSPVSGSVPRMRKGRARGHPRAGARPGPGRADSTRSWVGLRGCTAMAPITALLVKPSARGSWCPAPGRAAPRGLRGDRAGAARRRPRARPGCARRAARRRARAPDPDRVRAATRPPGQPRAPPHQPGAAERGLGPALRRRHGHAAHPHREPPAQRSSRPGRNGVIRTDAGVGYRFGL